jgi:hypothetical protein
MAKQVLALSQVLVKEQATFGAAETTLDNTNAAEVESPKLTIGTRVRKMALVSGGFSQQRSIIGPREASVSMVYPFRTGNAEASFGAIASAIKACGFKETLSDTDEDSSNDRAIYTPSNKQSEWKDLTVWGYSGNADASGALLRKIANVMGNGKITLDFNSGVALFNFDGKGILNAEDTAATQVSITPSAIVCPSLVGSTINFFGDDYDLISLEFDFGQEVTVTAAPQTETTGLGQSYISKRLITWKAKVYKDNSAIPVTTFHAGTTGPISVAWGTAPNKWTVSTTKAQIDEPPQDSDENGIETFDLSGICVDNDFAIQADSAVSVPVVEED